MKNKSKLPDPDKARRYFAKKLAFTTGPIEKAGAKPHKKAQAPQKVQEAETPVAA